MIVGTVKETFAGERRVAIVPEVVSNYAKKGFEVLVEKGAGLDAGFVDEAYEAKGAKLADSRDEVFEKADLIAQVRILGSNPDAGGEDFPRMRKGQLVIGSADPLSRPDLVKEAAPTMKTLAGETVPAAVMNIGKNLGSRAAAQSTAL
jgi:alanine dehydrogenase